MRKHVPVVRSHALDVRLLDDEKMCFPFGLTARAVTGSVSPGNVCFVTPDVISTT